MTVKEVKVFLQQAKELTPGQASLLENDQRRGVVELYKRYCYQKEAKIREKNRLEAMLSEELQLISKGFKAIAGVDEAGRGPLAGPVIAAAVILKPGVLIDRLNDSKQLSTKTRESLFEQVILNALSYGIAGATSEEIDQLNIHAATMLAMQRALEKLSLKPDYVLVDGFKIKDCMFRQKAIKGGDCLSMSIAAASILAKVSRDKIMANLHHQYPEYGFDRNKGYGTVAHREAITKHGLCPAHRRTFSMV